MVRWESDRQRVGSCLWRNKGGAGGLGGLHEDAVEVEEEFAQFAGCVPGA